MNEETSEEDRQVVEQQAEDFQKEKDEHEKSKKSLETEIEGIEEEIRAEEEKQPKPEPAEGRGKEGGAEKPMEVRGRVPGNFFGLNIQERDAMMARTDVKEFLERVRECIKEKRALTNVGLTIPDIMLPMIRQVATETSKLIRYVTVRSVGGTSRQNIMERSRKESGMRCVLPSKSWIWHFTTWRWTDIKCPDTLRCAMRSWKIRMSTWLQNSSMPWVKQSEKL